jgi:hypothetical protein
MLDILEVPLVDDDILKLGLRLLINLAFLYVLVFRAYYPHQKRKGYVFTYFMLNIMVFFLCFALKKLELGLGMALGLFAIFGIMRYRTTTIRIKEMTYLFLVVGIAAINSLTNKKTSYAELMFANAVIVFGAYFLERRMLTFTAPPSTEPAAAPKQKANDGLQQLVVFDDIALLRPERRDELIRSLHERLGLEASRVDVNEIDLRTNSAVINVHYKKSPN